MSDHGRPGQADISPWLFGRTTDLLTFLGSAVFSLALLLIGHQLGTLGGDAPPWLFLLCVIGIDVAHVWASLFRVYLDPEELARRRVAYLTLPAVVLLAGVGLYAHSESLYYRVLAYLAVFHFLRQQAGFLSLYQRRDGTSNLLHLVERSTLYLSMLYPLAHWHAHLPSDMAWMVQGDFVEGLPQVVASLLGWAYAAAGLAYVGTQGLQARHGRLHVGKLLLLSTTALCWYTGIVALSSDFAFTATNVLIHGVPYCVLLYRYGSGRAKQSTGIGLRLLQMPTLGKVYFVAILLTLAVAEEWLWHYLAYGDQAALFGEAAPLRPALLGLLIPLLTVPQVTHYLLDAMVWKRHDNPLLHASRALDATE